MTTLGLANMKILKYSLLSTLLVSSASFARITPVEAPTEQVILPSLLEVMSFCSSDKKCNSITLLINEESGLDYNVKYTNDNIKVTDPTSGDDD